ncbi:DMT family transporter [Bradyrhizobium sp. CCGUVB23]|uniref:DMT family transporter n=1 Tax=Bradyrhizobium sp. CCGUVB23 TaxID=2949630 RepID=UPI0020B3AD8C|nr:DMT family transporter [Bradyrhizobium sp. CCGUVB23]MCP3466708.1 DMT family transporter [Bradyrhizobium sp. CCGUVB23]
MSITPSKPMAALWMAGWLSLTLVMAVAGREAARQMNVFQLMEVRSLIGFVLLYPIIYRAGGFATLKTVRLPQHIVRNLIHYVSQLGWFFALTLIPIGQVVAIEFTMPIWTAILAASFLSERMTPWKIAAIMLGLVGVIIIVRPATGEINRGQLIALGAAMGFGVSMVLVKSLARTESALSILFWMIVVQAVAGFFPALYVWAWPPTYLWGWVIVVAICGTFAHYCLASAMRYADATIVVPMDFLRVPLTATAGSLLYSERLDAWTVFGAMLILLGNLLNLKSTAPVPAPRAVNQSGVACDQAK